MKVNLDRIKQLRLQNRLSLTEMAHYLGYKTANGYFYTETGRCNFKPEHIPLIARRFDVPIIDLFFEE